MKSNVIKLVDLLLEKKISVSLKDGSLELRGDLAQLSEEQVQQLRSHKEDLIVWLQQQQSVHNTQEVVIPLVDRGQQIKASKAQQHLWFIDSFEQNTAQYNMPQAMRITGKFDENLAEKVFEQLIKRHETLRTNIVKNESGELIQKIRNDFTFKLNRFDLTEVEEPSSAVQGLIDEDALKPFDLAEDLMLRGLFIRLSDEEAVLMINAHHIATDGWSMAVLMTEFSRLYEDLQAGRQDSLAPLTVQYADYVTWQGQQQRDIEQAELYWQQQLSELPQVHSLPTSNKRPSELDMTGANYDFSLNRELTAKVRRYIESHNLTQFMFLQGAFALTVAKFANNADVVMGVPVANRRLAQLQNLVGFFIDNQVLRSDCSAQMPIADYFEQVRKTHLDAMEFNQLSFHELIDLLKPARSTNHTPLFQIMFNLDNSATEQQGAAEPSAFALSPMGSDKVMAKYELQLTATPGSDAIGFNFEYNQSLFDQTLIAQFAQGLIRVIEQVLSVEASDIAAIDVLDAQQRHHLVSELNQTEQAFDRNVLMHELIEAQAAKTPDGIAVNYENINVSFDQLNRKANRLARHIQASGVGKGDVVGLVFDRSIELAVAMLAVMKTGAAYLPMDPEMPSNRLSYIMKDSGMKLVMTQLGYSESLANETPNPLCILDPVLDEQLGLLADDNVTLLGADAVTLPAYVIYTSGTTGQPKGVQVCHQALVNRINWMQRTYQLDHSDKVLQKTPYTFDVSVWEFMWPLSVGAQMVFARPGGHKDRHYLTLLIRDKKITTLHFVPSMFSNMLNSAEWHLCTSVKRVFCSGEALPMAIIKKHYKEHDGELHNLYGPTEAAIDVTAWHCRVDYDQTEVPIGKPIDNIQLFVLDGAGHLVPKGTIGELYIGGVGLAKGYVNNPELTAAAFVDNPFTPGEKLYKTGDLVRYLPDDNLAYLGRSDQQVKLRGLRIELGEIEHQLSRLELVGDVAVCMKEDASGRQHLVAYFTSDSELEPNQLAAAIQSELDQHLPDYMIPSQFVRMDEMPLSRNGKIARAALPEPNYLSLENYVAPTNTLETQLCQIFENGVGVERVGINDNFFSIGGDSIVAVRVVSDIAELDHQVTLKDLFKWPTPQKLCSAILAGETGKSAPILSVTPFSLLDSKVAAQIDQDKYEDAYPLSFLQQGMVHINDADQSGVIYRDQVNIRMRQPWNREVFEQAVNQLTVKHEILRTVFADIDNEQLQLVLKQFNFEQVEVDLRDLDEQGRENNLTTFTEAARIQEFAPELPLWRLVAYRLEDDLTTISFTCHHAILDGWSIASFLRALAARYESLMGQSRLSDVTSTPLKFNAYIANELAALNSSATKQFWTSRLQDAQMPWWTGARQAPLKVSRHPLNELEGRLDTLASSMQVPLNNLLLAAHMKLMALLNGTDEVASSVVSNGRLTAKGGDATLGLFLNTAPISLNTAGITWRELIEQTQEYSLAAQAHQYYPLAEIQRVVRKDFSGSLFNYLNFHVLDDMITQENRDGTKQQPYLTLDHEADTNYALTCNFRHERQFRTLILELRLHTSVFTEKHEEHMYYTMFNILSEMVKNTDREIDNRALLPTLDRALLMDNVSQNIEFSRYDEAVHDKVEQLAQENGDAIAIEEDDVKLNYRQLNERANQYAHYLISRGVTKGALVGLSMHRSADMVVALLGILKSGAAYLPVDTNYPAEYKTHMLNDAKLNIALARSSCIDLTLSESLEQFILIDQPEVAAQIDAMPVTSEGLPQIKGNDLAYVNYTSGTTGQPKGVMVEHQSVMRLTAMEHLQSEKDSPAMLFASSISFDAATLELWGALANGYRLVVYPHGHVDATRLNEMIASHQVSAMWLTSALFTQWANHSNNLSHDNLEKVFVGGDVVYPADVRAAYDSYANITVINGYGPTENTTFTCCYPIPRDLDMSESVPIGSSIEGTTVYILDEHGQPVPFGAVGELYAGGVGVSRGYLNNPQLTEERFVEDHYSQFDGYKLYRTGDLVRYRELGVIQFIGRRDEQVKVRGFRIELGQVETAIGALAQIDGVKVLVKEFDSGDKRLVAYVCPSAEFVGGSAELITCMRQTVAASLPEYMHPSHYLVLDAMPLTNNGKVDKKALAKMPVNSVEHAAAKVATEMAQLKPLWMKVLELNENEFNPEDDFFEMGGHSLLANKLVADIQETLKVTIEPLDVFEHPTFNQLGAFIKAKANGNEVSAALKAMWCDILDLEADELSDDSDFFDLGGHSLLANRLVGDIDKALGVALIPLDIFEAPTFAELTTLVERRIDWVRSPVKSTLAGQWSELLDLPVNELEDDTDFFEMGGHSLLANRLVGDIDKAFGVTLTPLDIFEAPTFAELVALVEKKTALLGSPESALLAAQWSEILDLPLDEIEGDTDFFEMGGHSLLANRMVANINKATGVSLTPLDIFEAPTFAEQIALLERKKSVALSPVAAAVASQWSELLDLPVSELEDDTDFFDMGGHSLLANRMVSKLSEELGVNIASADVFEYPSFGEFCRFAQSLQTLTSNHVDGLLRSAWMSLLDLRSDEIEATTDFFDMGGHSLLANRLVGAANPMLAVKLQPADIFDYPTFEEQINALRRNLPAQYTQVLQQVTQNWRELLDLNDEELMQNPDFFDMGGHSLLANRLVSSLNKAFKLSLSGLDVFENPRLLDCINLVLIHINSATETAQADSEDEQLDIVI